MEKAIEISRKKAQDYFDMAYKIGSTDDLAPYVKDLGNKLIEETKVANNSNEVKQV